MLGHENGAGANDQCSILDSVELTTTGECMCLCHLAVTVFEYPDIVCLLIDPCPCLQITEYTMNLSIVNRRREEGL
jgi:hypothetical protein